MTPRKVANLVMGAIFQRNVCTAVVEALTSWRRDGPPDNPGAWLQVAAQRNALDAIRRGSRQRALAALGQSVFPGPETPERPLAHLPGGMLNDGVTPGQAPRGPGA